MKSLAALAAVLASGTASVDALPISLGTEYGCGPFCHTNIADGVRTWAVATNTSQDAPIDANGWPMSDAFTVVFDDRAVPAWAPPLDDPWGWQAPLNGTYYFNLTGFANVTTSSDPSMTGVTVSNVTFDAGSWTTAGYLTLAAGAPNLVELTFTQTKRNASAAVNTGFTNLRIMRPGHWNESGAPGSMSLSPEMLEMLKPFDHFRFMGIAGTNTQPGYYGDVGHHALTSFDDNRCLPTDATWPSSLRTGCWGMPWEHVVEVSQATGKGVWINAPVSATVDVDHSGNVNTSTWVYGWAQLMKNGNQWTGGQGVPSNATIYLEHSNEVWNFGFGQYIWNKLAAIDECNVTAHPDAPPCDWNNDNANDTEKWAQRRHIAKAYQIGQTFQAVFGPGSVPSRIRPIYADWSIYPERYNETLAWFNATYGWPGNYFYGMAATGYFGGSPLANSTIDDIYYGYMNSSDSQYVAREQLAAIAASWGLKVGVECSTCKCSVVVMVTRAASNV